MSYDLENKVTSCFIGWTIAVLLAVFALTAPIINGYGRNANQHPGAMPDSYTMLAPDAYIVPIGTDPENICGPSGETTGVEDQQSVSQFKAVYINCYDDVQWNVKEAPSGSYSDALVTIFTGWVFYAAASSLAAFLFLFVILPQIRSDKRERERHRALTRAAQERKQIDQEQKRRELTKGYADGTLTDEQFTRGMDRLYSDGAKPADETIAEMQ